MRCSLGQPARPRQWAAAGHASALVRAGIRNGQLGHINAHGVSTREGDRIEAAVIHSLTPDTPVTAPKSYFANLGAAAGAMEMAVSLLALGAGCVPIR